MSATWPTSWPRARLSTMTSCSTKACGRPTQPRWRHCWRTAPSWQGSSGCAARRSWRRPSARTATSTPATSAARWRPSWASTGRHTSGPPRSRSASRRGAWRMPPAGPAARSCGTHTLISAGASWSRGETSRFRGGSRRRWAAWRVPSRPHRTWRRPTTSSAGCTWSRATWRSPSGATSAAWSPRPPPPPRRRTGSWRSTTSRTRRSRRPPCSRRTGRGARPSPSAPARLSRRGPRCGRRGGACAWATPPPMSATAPLRSSSGACWSTTAQSRLRSSSTPARRDATRGLRS
mmetsp:Transcript_72435/g.204778  ORF Transcript_72435/g.204778 Transcript_72435/m.204778 type:complete len:291 (+) Transcript_72435:99-971(+)